MNKTQILSQSDFSSQELRMISDYFNNIKKTPYKVYRNNNFLNLSYNINHDLIKMQSEISNDDFIVITSELLEFKLKLISQSNIIISIVRHIFFYVFSRLLPRLPFFSYVYSKKKNKNYALSRAEFIGRAIWSGFEVIEDYELDNLHHIIVKKSNTSYVNTTPSFFPIIGLTRLGLKGEMITIYKLRTMYPYSEYIQGYLRAKNGNTHMFKIENDYRISRLGEFFRKYWLDELPQLINLLKGDVQLIGVRPYSVEKFSILPTHVQDKRILLKPGILPPIYADYKEGFSGDDIDISDIKYTESVLGSKSPNKIKFKYFIKIIVNIIFNGARSN